MEQRVVCADAAAVASAAAPAATSAAQWLISIGVFVVCGCASIFFLAWAILAAVRFPLQTPMCRICVLLPCVCKTIEGAVSLEL